MHHTLAFYARNRERFLRWYIFFGRWTRLPLAGRAVRWVANQYGRNKHGGYLLTREEAEHLVGLSPVLAIGPCSCREVFHRCKGPVQAEIMLGKDHNPFVESRPGSYRAINAAEARQVLDDCRRRGLIHTIIKCREDFYAICNCCSCCCVPIRLRSEFGIGNALVRSPDIVTEFKAWLARPPGHDHRMKSS